MINNGGQETIQGWGEGIEKTFSCWTMDEAHPSGCAHLPSAS